MSEKLVHLRIKVKSLVDESRTIRKEANKTSGMAKWRLNHHRTSVVRVHTRHNLLAYGLLMGVPYCAMEKKCHIKPNLSTVAKHAKKFGGVSSAIDAWVEEAHTYLESQVAKLKLAS